MSQASYNVDQFGVPEGEARQRVGFYLPQSFGMLPFISALEPLRAANRYSNEALYSWHLYGNDDQPVVANNGMRQVVDSGISDAPRCDWLVVCGPHEPAHYHDATILSQLKRFARQGTRLGAIDTGTFLLARAGLIGKRRCTLHWENQPGFREEFPTLAVSEELYEIDGPLFTCAGGAAAFDMVMTLIELEHGSTLSMQVSELFIRHSIRGANEPQRMAVHHRTRLFHGAMVECIELMEANIEQPLSIQELADMVGLSKRQLERLFKAHLGKAPTQHYQWLRLQAGRKLLEQTTLGILDIALACGFSSTGHFSRRFRAAFDKSPTEARAEYARRVAVNPATVVSGTSGAINRDNNPRR